MATINISFDTISKDCSVTMNGQEIPDVFYASINKYDDENYIMVETGTPEVEGMRLSTRITAQQSEYDDLFVVNTEDVRINAASNFLLAKMK